MALLPKPNEMRTQYKEPASMQKQLQQLEAHAQENAHRYLVVLSGEELWVKETLASLLPILQPCPTLLVSDHAIDIAIDIGTAHKSIQAKQVKSHLGSEVDRLVWDGFSGLNPDALGAASGLIKGGGLLFLLLPDLTALSTQPDPDYLRMCRHPSELPCFGTRFLQRMIDLIETDHDICLFRQGTEYSQSHTTPINKMAPTHSKHKLEASEKLTADQREMLECIKTVANGHRKRPLVVMADRGRGKTSALGIAAAQLVIQHALKVIITAPNKRACSAAFQHYQQEITTRNLESPSSFEFYAPDTLLENLPECHILFVDEAASIPAPMLKQMLEAYPRIVFSSTTHGYEGTGQGFNVRFRHTLDTLTPQWKSLTLQQPVRWAESDPLERWIFEFLLLNAQIPTLPTIDLMHIEAQAVAWVSQDTLYNDTRLLKQVTALLVTAHYQTSPSDIRMILDDPKLTIGLIETNSTVVAVVLLLQEGGIDDQELANNIINGTRRPKGHLVPQALTSSTANPAFLRYQTYRIMRIAVHPSVSRHGLGSRLIGAAAQLSQKNNIDYLSASFGFTPLLNDFWGKNDFDLLRIGYHKDAASGAQSAIVVRTLNTAMQQNTIRFAQEQCRQHFIFGLNTIYRTLDVDTTLGALQSLSLPIKDQSNNEVDIIYSFAHHHRSYEDCAHILFSFIVNCFALKLIQTLPRDEQHLVCLRILKGESVAHCAKQLKLPGKKQLDTTLKTVISKLLNSTTKVEH